MNPNNLTGLVGVGLTAATTKFVRKVALDQSFALFNAMQQLMRRHRRETDHSVTYTLDDVMAWQTYTGKVLAAAQKNKAEVLPETHQAFLIATQFSGALIFLHAMVRNVPPPRSNDPIVAKRIFDEALAIFRRALDARTGQSADGKFSPAGEQSGDEHGDAALGCVPSGDGAPAQTEQPEEQTSSASSSSSSSSSSTDRAV